MPAWFNTFPPKYDPKLHDKYPGDTVKEKELNRIYDNLRKANAKGILLTIGSDSFQLSDDSLWRDNSWRIVRICKRRESVKWMPCVRQQPVRMVPEPSG